MKKLLFLLLFYPLFSFSQITDGVYNIVKSSSIVDGKKAFETDKTLGTSFFMVDLKNSSITLIVSDYIVGVYDFSETLQANGSVLYICTERKTGNKMKLMYKPHPSIKDAGELMIPQSSKWYDFFSILKVEK